MSLPLPGVIVFVGAPAPGANSVARLLARWASPPAAPRTSWCSSLPGGTGLSSPLPGVIVFVGAPAPGANSVARLLARWASSPAALRTSWCSSLPGLHWLGLASPSSPTLARRHRRRSAGALHPGGTRFLGTSSTRSGIGRDELALPVVLVL